jgi:hypothetical protein
MPRTTQLGTRNGGRTGQGFPLVKGMVPFGAGGTGTGPTVSAVSSGTPAATTATITWTTDVLSDSQVFWGLTTTYAGATSPIINGALVTSHSVTITGLITATVYHYKVRSRDPVTQGWSESADGTFTTA